MSKNNFIWFELIEEPKPIRIPRPPKQPKPPSTNSVRLPDGSWILTEEVRNKMHLAKSGRTISEQQKQRTRETLLGIPKSEETRTRMKIAKQNMSEETKLKMGIAKRNISEVTRQKFRDAKSGSNNPNYGKRKKQVV